MSPISILFIFFLTSEAQECVSRDYNQGGTVCVCTSDHCDSIPSPEKIEQPQYLKYTSNKAGLRFQKEVGTFTSSSSGINNIVIFPQEKFQTILGWGGAFTDSTGINIASLDESLRETLLKSYFSEEGIEYSLCRVPIGGTDFSTHGYSYSDDGVDEKLENFALAPEDFQFKIPYIQKALNLSQGNLRLLASAWTAPKWMKIIGEFAGPNGFLCCSMYQAWADYFVKFLDTYEEIGIDFWGITTGNEPGLALTDLAINSVAWTPSRAKSWILNNLGPTIRNSSHSDIKIIIVDDQRTLLPDFPDWIMSDEATRQLVDGVAVHWYFNWLIPPWVLSKTHDHFPDKFILSTEASHPGVVLGSWDRGEEYSSDIIENLLHWVGGWIDWNMAVDLTGGPTYIENFADSPIIVNATGGEFYKNPMYYHLGHFSKFIPRDSVRINSHSTCDNEVWSVAFRRPDNGTVVVVLNKKDVATVVTIIDNSRGTTEIELSQKSITTFLYW